MKRTQLLKIAAWFVALVVFYVLSIAPVEAACFLYAQRQPDMAVGLLDADRRLRLVYYPIYRVSHREPVKSALQGYRMFWFRIAALAL